MKGHLVRTHMLGWASSPNVFGQKPRLCFFFWCGSHSHHEGSPLKGFPNWQANLFTVWREAVLAAKWTLVLFRHIAHATPFGQFVILWISMESNVTDGSTFIYQWGSLPDWQLPFWLASMLPCGPYVGGCWQDCPEKTQLLHLFYGASIEQCAPLGSSVLLSLQVLAQLHSRPASFKLESRPPLKPARVFHGPRSHVWNYK